MVISKTPFRVSFFGGGTDYPAWYQENDGMVLSSSIDKYCYIAARELPPFFDYNYRIRYAKNEDTKTIGEIEHPSVRECLAFLEVRKGLEIQHTADLPSMSGLGSSSSFTVGLLHALRALAGGTITDKMQLALDAIHVEQGRIGESVGSQDQVVAAVGGFNIIRFRHDGISVEPMRLPPERLSLFQDHLLFFFTGFTRYASDVAAEKIKNIPGRGDDLRTMIRMAKEAVSILKQERNILDFGRLLDENWKIKRTLAHNVTNPAIDAIYAAGMKAGALGGKLLGAGGGGFILFFAEPERHASIRAKLKDLLYVPIRFENLGSHLIYNQP